MFVYKQVNFEVIKEIRTALKKIYGIGWLKAIFICARLGLAFPLYINKLNYYNRLLLFYVLDFFTWLEIRIKRIVSYNIKKHYEINSYKGIRHKDSLPVRGQRTRTNANTKKRCKVFFDSES